ncbi:MAG: hypothetical protein QM692_22040 [Thermomicrobiales bacterium]
MDDHHFDALARTLSRHISRRATVGAGLAGLAAGLAAATRPAQRALAQSATPTPLPVCTDPSRPGVGCGCHTGTQYPCGPTTLLCCATSSEALPGGPGICTPASVGCNPLGPPTGTPQATPAATPA